MNLARELADAAAAHAARPALLQDGAEVSYAVLDRLAAGAAALLAARGVAAGDRVALRLPNGPAFAAAWLGTLRLGAVAVPLNPLLAPPEVEARLAVAEPAALLDDEAELAAAPAARPEIAEREDGDPAVILFTSGTSGRPKGAVLTHGGIRAAARNAAQALRLGPDDVVLGAAPFSHVLGQSSGMVAPFLTGAAILVVRRFEAAETLALMTATRATILLGVPTMLIALDEAARSAAALPPVRIAHVGGAPVPVEVGRAFERRFGAEVYEGYGLTEVSGIGTTYVHGQPRKPGSVGTPLPGTEVRIGEHGEVQFRGPSVIPGYWRDPEATAAAFTPDGWLRTGDVGRLDEDGYLFLVDRLKDVILRGGYTVYPREVEEALYAHPDVLEAAVVGAPHATLGEEVVALVVPRPGAAPDEDALRGWARERVAAYAYPRRVLLVEELPKGPSGKILKRAIDRAALTRALDR